MTTEKKELQLQHTDGEYLFQSKKCLISLKFANGETAPTVEEGLVKILSGRLG